MATKTSLGTMESSSSNPCCISWRKQYEKMALRRHKLRDAVDLLQGTIKQLENEKQQLLSNKAAESEDQQKSVDLLDEEKGKEASLRASLENEVVALKSEIDSVKSDVASKNEEWDKERTLLQACISEKEGEIDRLKQLLDEESSKARTVKKATPSEKKKAAELQKALQNEKKRADEASHIAAAAKEKTEEDRLLIENLNNEVKSMSQKLEETNGMLEAEKQRVIDEKKKSDEEKTRAMELKNIAEANETKVEDEKCRAHDLSTMLEEEKQKVEKLQQELRELQSCQGGSAFSSQVDELVKNLEAEKIKVVSERKRADHEKSEKEELKKVAEANMKKVMEEKHRVDELSQEFQNSKQRIDILQQELSKVNCLLEAERTVSGKESKRADTLASKLKEHQKTAGEVVKSQLNELSKKLEAEKKKVAIEISEKEELKKVAEANMKKAMEEKHRADELSQDFQSSKQKINNLQQELSKVNCMLEAERTVSEKERKRADTLAIKLKEQQRTAREVEKPQLNVLSKKLEAEKKKVAVEKKHADAEMSAKEELKIALEANVNKAKEEKVRADKLLHDLQLSRQKIENLEVELNKVNCMLEAERLVLAKEIVNVDVLKSKSEERSRNAIENKNRAMEEKRQGDDLIKELEIVRQKLKDVENHLCEVKACRGPGGASSVQPDFVLNQQIAKINLLEEQLKFERKRVKHYKEVAMIEKERNSAAQKELHDVRSDSQCLVQQMNMLSDTFGPRFHLNKKPRLLDVQSLPGRMPSSSPPQLDLSCDAELRLSSLSSRDTSSHLKPSTRLVLAGQPLESPSGMKTHLKPLLGGSHGDILASSALNSNTASFSDEQLLGSQGRAVGPLITLEGLEARDRDKNPGITSDRWNVRERVGTVAENNINSGDVDAGHVKKRRKIVDEYESMRCKHSEGKEINQEAEMFGLHDPSVQPMIEQIVKVPLTSNNANLCSNFDLSGKKRKSTHEPQLVLQHVDDSPVQMEMDKPNSPARTTVNGGEISEPQQALRSDLIVCNQDDLVSFEQELNGDYMKLLDLDDAVAEEHFRMAMKSPLSPSLPDIVLHEFDKEFELQTDIIEEHDKIPDFCVVFSDMEDTSCIARIFCATRTCAARLRSSLRTRCLVKDILVALVSEQDLIPSSREKICIFFSLILLNYVGASPMEFRRQELVETFSTHLKSVLLNTETRHLFAKVCDLSFLIGLSEDFLLSRKILSKNIMTSDSLNCGGSRIEISYRGESNVLCTNMASPNMVVAGSVILASISAAAGLIGSLCEVSLKILKMSPAGCSMALLILHTFAHVCGEEYLTASNYGVVMKVVKSLVTSTEGSLATNDNLEPGYDTWDKSFPCERCPFANGFICLDDVLPELLQEVQGYTKHRNQADALDSCFLVAVLSSLELLADNMSWDWVCDKVVSKILKILASCNQEEIMSAALVALLSHLGRRGVQAGGYDDAGVRSIKQQLPGFLHRANALKGSTLPNAIVHALIKLHPNGHEVLMKSNEVQSAKGAHSASATVASASDIRTIFSTLSSEQTSVLLNHIGLLSCEQTIKRFSAKSVEKGGC